jgi:protein-S-isoprenylcysteine O-methyltransferase Ste14
VGPVNDVGLADPPSIVSVTMTCIFATAFQFSAPTMAGESRSKTGLKRVFGVATILSYATKVLLGILLAMFFGQDQADSSNLNWGNYHGGTGLGDDSDTAAWATAISGYIVLFAAVAGVTVYSLIAISTGEIPLSQYNNNMYRSDITTSRYTCICLSDFLYASSAMGERGIVL